MLTDLLSGLCHAARHASIERIDDKCSHHEEPRRFQRSTANLKHSSARLRMLLLITWPADGQDGAIGAEGAGSGSDCMVIS